MRKITKLCLHLLKLCRKNSGLFFSGHGVYCLSPLFSDNTFLLFVKVKAICSSIVHPYQRRRHHHRHHRVIGLVLCDWSPLIYYRLNALDVHQIPTYVHTSRFTLLSAQLQLSWQPSVQLAYLLTSLDVTWQQSLFEQPCLYGMPVTTVNLSCFTVHSSTLSEFWHFVVQQSCYIVFGVSMQTAWCVINLLDNTLL